jgi:hypothetical protein
VGVFVSKYRKLSPLGWFGWLLYQPFGGDIAWVLASIVLVALYYESITTTGLMLIDVVSIAVLAFAVMQIRGLRAYRREA